MRFKVPKLSFTLTKPQMFSKYIDWQNELFSRCTFERNIKFNLVHHFLAIKFTDYYS